MQQFAVPHYSGVRADVGHGRGGGLCGWADGLLGGGRVGVGDGVSAGIRFTGSLPTAANQ